MKSKWILDPTHSEVNFKVKHLVISTVSGSFRKFDGFVENAEADDFADARVHFEIDANSIDTNQGDRDTHLRSADFFNAEQYPKIVFDSTSLSKVKAGEWTLKGNLTIKDHTQPITLDVEFGGTVTDPYGNFKAGFDVTGKLKRKEYGLTWNAVTEAGSVVVADEIKILASVQFVKQ